MTEGDSMFVTGENESLFKVSKRRIWLESLIRPMLNCLSNFELILMATFIFELQSRFIYSLHKEAEN